MLIKIYLGIKRRLLESELKPRHRIGTVGPVVALFPVCASVAN